MKICIESTTKTITFNGLPARIWEGHTESGIPIHCYITRVAVAEGLPESKYAQFEQELAEQRKPSAEIMEIPLHMVL